MAADVDDRFYDRADAHIHLANEHTNGIGRGKVSASFLYAAARFNAYVAACNTSSRANMEEERANIRDYYVKEYTKMLEEHLGDYIDNYESYMDRSA